MPPRSIRSAVVACSVAALALLTSACRVDTDVRITADDRGGGEITVTARLDEGAAAQLGGETPEKRLALDDLTEAGWEVEGPARTPDGGIDITASHDFRDGEEARRLLEDVGGENGPFRNVRLTQERSFLKTVSSFTGTVDLSAGLAAFTDPALREALAEDAAADQPAGPLGLTDEQLTDRFGGAPADLLRLRVEVRVPGADPVARAPKLGERARLESRSERWNVRNIASAATAAVAGLALLAVLGGRAIRRPRRHPVPSSDVTEEPRG